MVSQTSTRDERGLRSEPKPIVARNAGGDNCFFSQNRQRAASGGAWPAWPRRSRLAHTAGPSPAARRVKPATHAKDEPPLACAAGSPPHQLTASIAHQPDLDQQENQQADADESVDVEKCLVHAREIVGPDQGMLVDD